MLKLTGVLRNSKPRSAAAGAAPEREVLATLQKLQREHTLIYVARTATGGGNQGQRTYQSIILEVNPGAGTLTIDELFPTGLLLHENDRVSVTVRTSKHRSLTFHTRVAERLSDGDQPSYSLVLPSQLDGHQRRNAFRLATQGSARWQMGSIEIDQARVSDISISGVQISLPETPGDSPPLAVGEAIENCNLQIASLNLHCDLRVARIAEADSGITTIGAQMVTLDSSERRQLEQFIMREQRLQRLRSAV